MHVSQYLLLVLVMYVATLQCFAAQAQQPIKFGMSAPFTGPAAQLGQQFSHGANLAFAAQNAQGGIAGRPIQLVTVDDGYEPVRTVENTRIFLQDPQLFALFGYVGTPTSNAILPLLRKYRLPYLAAFTGADILRGTADEFIFNFRASYREEAAAQISYLVDERKLRRVALFIQADEFGASVAQWFSAELSKRQLKPVTVVRFQRNSMDMQHAVLQLKAAAPDVVLTVGTYQPLATVIKLGQQQNFNPIYSVVSFTGIQQLQRALQPPYSVYASMVVPDPDDLTTKFVQAYRQALGADTALKSDVSMEGFAAATLLVGALKSCQATLTRDCVMQQLPKQRLYDFNLKYLPAAHQASQQIFLYQITSKQLLQIH